MNNEQRSHSYPSYMMYCFYPSNNKNLYQINLRSLREDLLNLGDKKARKRAEKRLNQMAKYIKTIPDIYKTKGLINQPLIKAYSYAAAILENYSVFPKHSFNKKTSKALKKTRIKNSLDVALHLKTCAEYSKGKVETQYKCSF